MGGDSSSLQAFKSLGISAIDLEQSSKQYFLTCFFPQPLPQKDLKGLNSSCHHVVKGFSSFGVKTL